MYVIKKMYYLHNVITWNVEYDILNTGEFSSNMYVAYPKSNLFTQTFLCIYLKHLFLKFRTLSFNKQFQNLNTGTNVYIPKSALAFVE